MKKIVFAVQVFVLSAMFPLYLVSELNHGNRRLPLNNSASEFTGKLKENNTRSASGSKEKGSSFSIPETNTYLNLFGVEEMKEGMIGN